MYSNIKVQNRARASRGMERFVKPNDAEAGPLSPEEQRVLVAVLAKMMPPTPSLHHQASPQPLNHVQAHHQPNPILTPLDLSPSQTDPSSPPQPVARQHPLPMYLHACGRDQQQDHGAGCSGGGGIELAATALRLLEKRIDSMERALDELSRQHESIKRSAALMMASRKNKQTEHSPVDGTEPGNGDDDSDTDGTEGREDGGKEAARPNLRRAAG